MCLYTDKKSPLIAEKDIKIWKLVYVGGDGEYYSPWQNVPLCNKPLEDEYELSEDHAKGMVLEYPVYKVNEGFIHAYCDEDYAKSLLRAFLPVACNPAYGEYYKIIEGIIPKGTEYFMDLFRDEVCAREVRYDKRFFKIEKEDNAENK